MKQKKKQIDELFGLSEQSSETVTKKVMDFETVFQDWRITLLNSCKNQQFLFQVQVYRQSTIQDLQLALFHRAAGLKVCYALHIFQDNPVHMGKLFIWMYV